MNAGPFLLATRSLGKLHELRPLFERAGVAILDLDEANIPESSAEDDLEAFETFEENALAKARHFRQVSGLPTIADDSGLEVRALRGRPGVRSKRWSGRADLRGRALDVANNATLVAAMRDARDDVARYVCVAALVDERGEVVCRGEVDGRIVLTPRGREGFGYDPYFEVAELGLTFGECDAEAKEFYSHRGRAFRQLLPLLLGRG